ncbi:HigA family addiction module antitoxin [Thiocapsa sp.]|uniref:HigA family addiction module antitoxin n=1 Tax=Thiocapsa sp. TaxID=2024551 RepID=UPI0035939474
MPPITPGEILREDCREPLGLSANALDKALRVPPNRITAILSGTRSNTADTALRLARYFNGQRIRTSTAIEHRPNQPSSHESRAPGTPNA